MANDYERGKKAGRTGSILTDIGYQVARCVTKKSAFDRGYANGQKKRY